MFLTEPEIILIVVFQKKANLNNFENEMEKLILNSVIKVQTSVILTTHFRFKVTT